VGCHEGAVRMLLERSDVNTNNADNWGQEPLSLAAMYEHEGIVRMLQKRNDANPSKMDG